MKITSIAKVLVTLIAPIAIVTSVYAADTLTDKKGMTLYTFDKDSNGVSNCNNDCASKWPPFTAAADAKAKEGYGFITRKDGTRQWTYNNKPLYNFAGDQNKGDTNGEGLGGVWHTATKSAYSY